MLLIAEPVRKSRYVAELYEPNPLAALCCALHLLNFLPRDSCFHAISICS